jgi:hypothetical protein
MVEKAVAVAVSELWVDCENAFYGKYGIFTCCTQRRGVVSGGGVFGVPWYAAITTRAI